ncbi:MAG: hypothetical protein CSYNP_00840 [Syntrophus sp. SKADARSKE-3]|nr:hypothetical protein [Syntrophus sp. SKADARSKE-3]
MEERITKLIAVGASVGANCHPCLEYNVAKALEAGIDREEIMEAANVGKAIRSGAASSMDKLAFHLIRNSLPKTSEKQTPSCCCS